MPQPLPDPSSRRFALILLGSNVTSELYSRQKALAAAIAALSEVNVEIVAKSRIFETPAFPDPADLAFFNAVVKIETQLGAQALLDLCHSIEVAMGRERERRWAPRVVDLDILAFGDEKMDEVLPDQVGFGIWQQLDPALQMAHAPAEIILPHPRIQDRAFVLVPMAEIAPDWRHPVLGLSVTEMLAQRPLAECDAIVPAGVEF